MAENAGEKGYEVIDGACFGYYDETFNECLACDYREACGKCAESPEAQEVRRSIRNDPARLAEAVKRFSA